MTSHQVEMWPKTYHIFPVRTGTHLLNPPHPQLLLWRSPGETWLAKPFQKQVLASAFCTPQPLGLSHCINASTISGLDWTEALLPSPQPPPAFLQRKLGFCFPETSCVLQSVLQNVLTTHRAAVQKQNPKWGLVGLLTDTAGRAGMSEEKAEGI